MNKANSKEKHTSNLTYKADHFLCTSSIYSSKETAPTHKGKEFAVSVRSRQKLSLQPRAENIYSGIFPGCTENYLYPSRESVRKAVSVT